MKRYSETTKKNPREVVLLKGKSCKWGKCSFCDYILDNTNSDEEANKINFEVLQNVRGTYKALEIDNSGSVFELPIDTLKEIKRICDELSIEKLYFESHWMYRDRLDEIRNFFNIPIVFKLGLETFDDKFRNNVYKKGIKYNSISEVKKYFESICLLVGVEGQTKEMIDRDINTLIENFEYGCINVFNNNTTKIKADDNLAKWIYNKYKNLDEYPLIDILYHNTDFNVGDINE